MCDQVAIEGKCIDRQGELQDAMGGMIVMAAGEFDRESCLCPVDLEATARKYGYECRYSREFYDFEFVKPSGDERVSEGKP